MTSLLLVYSRPVKGKEDEYNTWYDEVHLHDVASIPGVASAQRFDVQDFNPPGAAPPIQSHLAVYEIEGDPAAVMAEMQTRYGTDQMRASAALDLTNVSMTVWTPRDGKTTADK